MSAERRRGSRKIEILKSAVDAFRRRGFHGASMDQIARALGMQKGTLYYYFKSKEAILFFCHDSSLDILTIAMPHLVEAVASAPEGRAMLREPIAA